VNRKTRPNIVFILADDLGYFDLGCYGNPFNKTPVIDRLAKEGMKFTQAYSASPVCSPSRAAILTAQHPARLHLTNFLGGFKKDPDSPVLPAITEQYLSSRQITLAELLQANGYRTGIVGKWNL
jgi:arylsulfatase A-like enzyme